MSSIINITKRFNHIIGEINAAFHEAALKMGLSDSAMALLYTICMEGDVCPVSEVCRLSGMPKQTVNSVLRKLEGEGLVRLIACGGKKKTICLTESGKAFADGTARRILEIEDEIYACWSEVDREKYIELSQRYLTAFKEKIENL